jgi:hypothetical protein
MMKNRKFQLVCCMIFILFIIFIFAINYYFGENWNIVLSLEYVDGENPVEGLTEQRYTQMTLRVKF